jgi:hypothetical protein
MDILNWRLAVGWPRQCLPTWRIRFIVRWHLAALNMLRVMLQKVAAGYSIPQSDRYEQVN